MKVAPDSTLLWGNGSRITYSWHVPAKPYPVAKPAEPWNGDGLTYYPATGCKRLLPEGTVLGHPNAKRGNAGEHGITVAHDVNLGPVILDEETGDRWPL